MKPDPQSEKPEDDILLRALRELPRPTMDTMAGTRLRRDARAAFVRAHAEREGARLPLRVSSAMRRVLVPVALASVVGVYLTWALTTASSLLQ